MNQRYIEDGFVIVRSQRSEEMLAKELNEASSLNIKWTMSNPEAI